ncbi:MAG: hypothetical protein ACO3CS_06670, partial [Alphaproteobacteria bacterium]
AAGRDERDSARGRCAGRRGRLAPEAEAAIAAFPRQALDAVVLVFQHPRSGERLRFERPLRSDMVALLRILEEAR